MGLLCPQEMGPLLLRALRTTKTKLALDLKTDDRTLRGILHENWPHKVVEAAILTKFRERLPVFWSEWADLAVDAIRAEEDLSKLNATLRFPMEMEYLTLSQINPAGSSDWMKLTKIEEDLHNDLFGRTYGAAAYYAHIARGGQSSIDPKKALKYQEVLVNQLLSLLAQLPANELTTHLKLKIGVERLILVAELLSREAPKNQVEAFVNKNGFFQAIYDYNDITPRIWQAPWSGLSIASFLHQRQHYPEMLRRLFASKAFKSVDEMRARNSFDSHFDDFDEWYANLNPQEKESDDA